MFTFEEDCLKTWEDAEEPLLGDKIHTAVFSSLPSRGSYMGMCVFWSC